MSKWSQWMTIFPATIFPFLNDEQRVATRCGWFAPTSCRIKCFTLRDHLTWLAGKWGPRIEDVFPIENRIFNCYAFFRVDFLQLLKNRSIFYSARQGIQGNLQRRIDFSRRLGQTRQTVELLIRGLGARGGGGSLIFPKVP